MDVPTAYLYYAVIVLYCIVLQMSELLDVVCTWYDAKQTQYDIDRPIGLLPTTKVK